MGADELEAEMSGIDFGFVLPILIYAKVKVFTSHFHCSYYLKI